MTAPNIVNVTTITGKTVADSVTTAGITVVSNGAASGEVFKVNSIIISNIDGTNDADVTVQLNDGTNNYALASTITVPADSTLVVISKDMGIYLEEGWSITSTASADGDLQAICSYEVVA